MPTLRRYAQLYKQKWKQIGGQEGILKRFLHGTATDDFRRMANNKPLNREDTITVNNRRYYAYPKR